MKRFSIFFCVLLASCFCVNSSALCSSVSAAVVPDTVGNANGWRYATAADAAYWDNVDVGDVILFGKLKAEPDYGGQQIRSIYINFVIDIANVHKIHIYRGDYAHIILRGASNGFINDNSTEANPLIITNLGGQVRFGAWGTLGTIQPNLSVGGINHVLLTGAYDPVLGTGDANFRGLDGNLAAAGWINRFGFQGDQHYANYTRGKGSGLGVVARSFLTIKVRGIAALHGFFTGFSIKSDDLGTGAHTKLDVQKCLSGWHDGEGFYLGSTGTVDAVPSNQIICQNNVALFTGAEGIQADKMTAGSRITNNFIYKTGCYYQVPFQGAHFQENTFQWSFLQGDIRTEDNIIYGGGAGSMINGTRLSKSTLHDFVPGTEVVFQNNLIGPSRRYITNVLPSDDDQQAITFRFNHNVFDSVTIPMTNDAYTDEEPLAWITFINADNPTYLTNNIYPAGRSLYTLASNVVSGAGSAAKKAPYLKLHDQFGFDPREILNFRGIWLTGSYNGEVESSGPIAYRKGDMVYMWEGGVTRYYRCILAHNTPQKPSTQPTYWQKMTWSGQDEPTYTPLLKPDTYYNYRGMGLEANPANTQSPDTLPPTIAAQVQYFYRVGDTFSFPSATASDNRDGNVTGDIDHYWKDGAAPPLGPGNMLTQHGTFDLMLNVEDDAGNRAEPLTVRIKVSDPVVNLTDKSKLNFHINSPANLTTAGNYWVDIAEDGVGLKDATSTSTDSTRYTRSILKDTTGALLPWTVRIDDSRTSGFYSTFAGELANSSSYAIGDFPPIVTRYGLQLRQGLEDEVHILYRNLDPTRFYDFFFTGLKNNTAGEVIVGVADSVSGQKVQFNVVNNTQVFALTDLQPDAQGRISLIHTLDGAMEQTGRALSQLSGFIIVEKDAYGVIGSGGSNPGPSADARTVQIHVTYAGSPALQAPGEYWTKLTVANSNSTYSANNLTAKDGTTATPIDVSVVKTGDEGFNYANGVNTGLTTGNNSGAVPDVVLQYFAVANDQPANITLSGLNTSKTYTVQTLSNGRSIWAGNSRYTAVTVQGVKQTQDCTPAGGNTDELLTWNNVAPTAAGQISVTVAGEDQTIGVLNALIVIEETGSGGGGGLPPTETNAAATDEIRLYPMPVNGGVLNVSYEPRDTGKATHAAGTIRAVSIVDQAGRYQGTRVVSATDKVWTVDVSSLRGFYIIRVDTGRETHYKTFVVY